ncbi:MAG TPA: alcohol dehydrogenase catalytic domain-containing protein [Microlunatus sp.]
MKALVYGGPGSRRWTAVADPELVDQEDVLVRVDAVTLCGTDLHILRGDVPSVSPGRVLGHEAVGTVLAAGMSVRTVAVGDRVLVSCISPCGVCCYCRAQRYGLCIGGGGWVLGHRIDGVQAERVRVPFADRSVHRLPEGVSDESALMLADIMPTAYEVGALNGQIRPGATVVVVGAGPIGLAAIVSCSLFSPLRTIVVDPAEQRRDAALGSGADEALADAAEAERRVAELTDGRGADVVLEAVGVPEAFDLCTRLVAPGGHLANIGVHGSAVPLHLETLWDRDVTITTGLVDTSSTPTLLSMLASGRLRLPRLVTHRFGLDEIQDAYDVFSRPAETGAIKVVMFGQAARDDTSTAFQSAERAAI